MTRVQLINEAKSWLQIGLGMFSHHLFDAQITPDPKYIKGIKNGWPCIVEIRGTQGCVLDGDSARAVGECRDVAKAQP